MKILGEILSVQRFKSNILTYMALFIGISLLLISVQLYIDTYAVMSNKQIKNDKYEYLVINKNITNDMMGDNSKSLFSAQEIGEFEKLVTVKKIGFIESNQFPIEASNFGDLAFSTQLFFESIPDEYLDVSLESFRWHPGSKTIPVILSQDFLNLYNFGFALSQGLPQLSEETVKAISFNLEIARTENYVAEVVGFSQRYSSVIVPAEFMHYANTKFGTHKAENHSRIILQTEEADNPELVKFIHDRNYSTQNEKIKWSKIKTIMNVVFASSGFIGIFILVLCVMILVLFLNLSIAKSASKLQLLSLLGYQTATLQKKFINGLFFSFLLIVLLALITTLFCKFYLAVLLASFQISISKVISWQILVILIVLLMAIYYLFWIKSKKIIQHYIA
ncbi:MAG: hypothetical protein IPJ31_02760 [Bacteroidetes bacterium]|nr:hypothetical protein [Bacteroidota bacterium]